MRTTRNSESREVDDVPEDMVMNITTTKVKSKKKSKTSDDPSQSPMTGSEAPAINGVSSEKKKKSKTTNETCQSPVTASEASAAINGESSEKKKKKSKRNFDEVSADDTIVPEANDSGKENEKKKRKSEEKGVVECNGKSNGEISNGMETRHSSAESKVSSVDKEKKKSKKKEAEVSDESSAVKTDDPGHFSKFRISKDLVKRLQSKGIQGLFPVQQKSFNSIYDEFDVIVQSRTGSGKTLTFAIPLVERLSSQQKSDLSRKVCGRAPKILVMAPTRELAKQVADTFTDISDPVSLVVLSVYGGTQIYPQERALRGGVDVLVGTPGRIQDLINRGSVDLSQLQHVVLDEVDRMLDMGFADDVDKILQQRYTEGGTDKNPQTLLFSATLPDWVHQTAKKYLRTNRQHIDLIGNEVVRTSKTVRHLAIRCNYFDRPPTINSVLQAYSGSLGRSIVFCETKKDADELSLSPEIKQETQVIHGDIPQEKREKVLKGFREGRHRCLIATDVAARGLDIPEIDLVIQCCPPKDVESYIHRAGRTGRAGREGVCVLFYKPNYEEYEVTTVERKAGIKFERIGAPSPRDLLRTSALDAVRNVEEVKEKTISHFTEFAEELLTRKFDEQDKKSEAVLKSTAVNLLAAALALVSGNADVKQRSLINCKEGFTTFIYRSAVEMNFMGYAHRALERCFTSEIKEKVQRMKMFADKKGCVFDLPADVADEALSLWRSGHGDSLTVAEELPPLQEVDFSNGRSGGGGFHRGGGGRTFRGRGRGEGGSRGFSRGSSFRGRGNRGGARTFYNKRD